MITIGYLDLVSIVCITFIAGMLFEFFSPSQTKPMIERKKNENCR